jgi:hypothetical protein
VINANRHEKCLAFEGLFTLKTVRIRAEKSPHPDLALTAGDRAGAKVWRGYPRKLRNQGLNALVQKFTFTLTRVFGLANSQFPPV